MSLTAVPVFFWGRRLMSERWALVAAGLTLTLPAFAYSGLLMTETVFLPAMTLVAWMAAESLARPSRRSHAFLLGAFALALLTRLQALVVVPAFLLALVLLALVERSTDPFRRSWPAAAGLLGLGAFWLVLGGFGAYEPAGETSYSIGGALKFIVYHAGDVLLLVGLAPACAVVLLALEAARRAPDASDNLSYGASRLPRGHDRARRRRRRRGGDLRLPLRRPSRRAGPARARAAALPRALRLARPRRAAHEAARVHRRARGRGSRRPPPVRTAGAQGRDPGRVHALCRSTTSARTTSSSASRSRSSCCCSCSTRGRSPSCWRRSSSSCRSRRRVRRARGDDAANVVLRRQPGLARRGRRRRHHLPLRRRAALERRLGARLLEPADPGRDRPSRASASPARLRSTRRRSAPTGRCRGRRPTSSVRRRSPSSASRGADPAERARVQRGSSSGASSRRSGSRRC